MLRVISKLGGSRSQHRVAGTPIASRAVDTAGERGLDSSILELARGYSSLFFVYSKKKGILRVHIVAEVIIAHVAWPPSWSC